MPSRHSTIQASFKFQGLVGSPGVKTKPTNNSTQLAFEGGSKKDVDRRSEYEVYDLRMDGSKFSNATRFAQQYIKSTGLHPVDIKTKKDLELLVSAVVQSFVERLQANTHRSQTSQFVRRPAIHVTDNVTGLQLLPVPPVLYSERARVYGSKISVAEFLTRTYPKHTHEHLLYAGYLRHADNALYQELFRLARCEGEPFRDYALRHGIMTREHLGDPPPGLERQAAVLRDLRKKIMAASTVKTAIRRLEHNM